MLGPISNSKKFSEHSSHRRLAKALLDAYPNADWGMNDRSLGNRLAELDREIITWWRNNPSKAHCLAEFLELSPEDLGLHERTCSIALPFQDFPELPPLDFKHDEGWQIANEELEPSQKSTATTKSKPTLELWLREQPAWVRQSLIDFDWLFVPDDLHRRLLALELSASGRYEVFFTDTLYAAVIRLRNPKPVIVVVEQDGGDKDLAALAERPEDAGILIIAPFMFSPREETSSAESWSWEARTTKGKDRRIFDLSAQPLASSHAIKRWVLRKHPDWREKFLTWVERRLDRSNIDTHFSAQAVAEWLKIFDKYEQWFCTTSDLMQLCHLAHRGSEKCLPKPTDPEAGARLAGLLFEREPTSRAYLINKLAFLRWDSSLSWVGTLPIKDWLAISGSDWKMISRNDFDVIVAAKTVNERSKAADHLVALLDMGNPDSLLRSGLLKEITRGNYDYQYRTFVSLLVRDRLLAQISNGSLEAWALNCFDPTRRSIIDAAFDVAPIDALVNAAYRLTDESSDSPQSIAAAETMFIAIGRRIARLENIPNTLHLVAKQVFRNLDIAEPWKLPSPLTRPMESSDDQLAWACACWSWSLLPEAEVEGAAGWSFPGWERELPEPPYWLVSLMPEKDDENPSPAFLDFWQVLIEWSKEIDSPADYWPPAIIATFLCKAVKAGQPAQSAWWKSVVGQKWAEKIIYDCCEQVGGDAASRLWPSFVVAEREVAAAFNSKEKDTWQVFSFQSSRIRFWLLEHLKPVEVTRRLGIDDLRYLAQRPETLPPEVRSDLLLAVKNFPTARNFSNGVDFFKRFGRQVSPALEEFLEHEELGYGATVCLWQWDPERALTLLAKKDTITSGVRKALYWQCSQQHFPRALELLMNEPDVFDREELQSWVRNYLPNAREHAVLALALLKAQ